jgi:hypothetical protein
MGDTSNIRYCSHCTLVTSRRARDAQIRTKMAPLYPTQTEGVGRSPPNCAFHMERYWNAQNPRLGNDLGQEGATFNFKTKLRFPGGLGVELVSKPRRSGVRVCRVVQGHGIPRSPQGAAIATNRREGAGGPLLREEPSTHQVSQKDWKPFHRTTAKWSIGSSCIKHKPEPESVQHRSRLPWQWLGHPIGTHVAWRS